MKRIDALKLFCKGFHGFKLSCKISEAEFDEMIEFLEEWDHLGTIEFEHKINRWYLDNPNKPKHLFIMAEILMSANSKASAQ